MTIAVDTSALAAVVFGEADAELYLAALTEHAGALRISAATLTETNIVIEARQGPAAAHDLQLLLRELGADIVPFSADHCAAATRAWQRFGKGRHPAGLNLGDCYTYALAKTDGIDLLFKGDDFSQTDIGSVL